jgi:hypothetical protein
VLFDEQNMAVLEDMVSAALWHLGRRAHAGDLNNACLSYVLVSCGQHAVTMLEGTTCRSVDRPTRVSDLVAVVCVRTNGLIAGATLCTALWSLQGRGTYFESCKARQLYASVDQSVEHECIDAEFYKLWYMIQTSVPTPDDDKRVTSNTLHGSFAESLTPRATGYHAPNLKDAELSRVGFGTTRVGTCGKV